MEIETTKSLQNKGLRQNRKKIYIFDQNAIFYDIRFCFHFKSFIRLPVTKTFVLESLLPTTQAVNSN